MTPPNGSEFYRALADVSLGTAPRRSPRRRPRPRRVRRALGVRMVNVGLRLIDGAVRADSQTMIPRIGIQGEVR